ncbi:MAG: hypothetical protein U0174_01850 [Polyangiaceae bacterium]
MKLYRAVWFAVPALFVLNTVGCASEAPESGESEEDVVAAGSCTGTAKTTANKAWNEAAALAKALPTSAASPSSKLDPIAAKLVVAVDACSGFERLLIDRSYKSANATALRASGGALAYAVKRSASADECTDPAPIADAVYATTSLNSSYKATVKGSSWTANVRKVLANNFVLAELNGTSKGEGAFDVKAAFGNVTTVRFAAPRPGVFPVLDVRLAADGTFSIFQTNGATGDVEEVKGTWTSSGGSVTLKSATINQTATVRRVSSTKGAPTYEFKLGETVAFSYDPDLCSA